MIWENLIFREHEKKIGSLAAMLYDCSLWLFDLVNSSSVDGFLSIYQMIFGGEYHKDQSILKFVKHIHYKRKLTIIYFEKLMNGGIVHQLISL